MGQNLLPDFEFLDFSGFFTFPCQFLLVYDIIGARENQATPKAALGFMRRLMSKLSAKQIIKHQWCVVLKALTYLICIKKDNKIYENHALSKRR